MTRQGIGAEIVRRLIEEGDVFGVEKYFTLTYKPGFFQKLGFQTITKEELPHKVWKECIDCPKFPNCDEIAMIAVCAIRVIGAIHVCGDCLDCTILGDSGENALTFCNKSGMVVYIK